MFFYWGELVGWLWFLCIGGKIKDEKGYFFGIMISWSFYFYFGYEEVRDFREV